MKRLTNRFNFVKTLFIAAQLLLFVQQYPAHASSQQINTPAGTLLLGGEQILNKVSCRLGNDNFEVVLTSPTTDIAEDDVTLWFVKAGQAVRANPGKLGYIAFLPAILKITPICDAVASVPLPKGLMAIPLFLSGRPDLDSLAVAVYNPTSHKVMKYEILRRYYGEEAHLVATKNGFSYLAVSSQTNDSPEGLEETWLNITWNGKQLVKRWDHSRPKVRH